MKPVINVMFAWLSLYWYSISFPVLFEDLFISINLHSVIGPCRDAFSVNACRPLARAVLWLMELPVSAVSFAVFALALVALEKYVKKVQLSFLWLFIGVVSGYLIMIIVTPDTNMHISYHLVPVLTCAGFLLLGLKSWRYVLNEQ
jgi:hypothetical protein